jgi:YD repeat-containing protein
MREIARTSSGNNDPASGSTTLTIQNSGPGPGVLYSYSVPTTGGYDLNGNVLSYTDTVMGAWTFSYDQLNRLTGAAALPAVNERSNFCWIYDSFGNRTLQSASDQAFATQDTCEPAPSANVTSMLAVYSDGQNQLAPAGYSYDGAGDVSYDGSNQYVYDAEGRICAVDDYSLGGWVGYLYDAAGNRVAKGNSGCEYRRALTSIFKRCRRCVHTR